MDMNKKCELSIYKWKKIKGEYSDVYKAGGNFSPFMSPLFIKYTLKHKLFFSKSRSKKFIVVKGIFSNGIIYAPLLVDNEAISLIGDYTSASYTGFVFSNSIKKEDIKAFVDELVAYFEKDYIFEKIMPADDFYTDLHLSNGTLCMKIDYDFDFDKYFGFLSKSVRQNYRTAINRMNREGKKYYLRFYISKRIPSRFKRKMLSLYVKRSAHWDEHNRHLMNKVHRRFFDLMNNSLDRIENSFCSILFIDNKICGFMMGVFTNDKSICTIPRLAVDTKYGVYCPGSILIIDSIRELIKHDCYCLDLSRGNEQYKYRAGAKEYYLLSGLVKK